MNAKVSYECLEGGTFGVAENDECLIDMCGGRAMVVRST